MQWSVIKHLVPTSEILTTACQGCGLYGSLGRHKTSLGDRVNAFTRNLPSVTAR